jgi:parvulin-like peptidyl-prolyl isomerase
MRRVLAIALLATCAVVAQAAVPTDQALRYVNSEVITLADVIDRVHERLDDYRREGRVAPSLAPRTADERAALLAFFKESLEQLTDEELMLQRAKELKLVPDHDRVVLEVLTRARQLGTGLPLADQAKARKLLERTESIDLLLSYFFEIRTPEPTPQALRAEYIAHQKDFRRPPKARVLQIIMRPSDPALAKDVRRQKTELFKRTQDAPDQAVAQIASSRLQAYLDGDAAAQTRLLDELIQDLCDAGKREDLDAKSRELTKAAQAVHDQESGIRDLDQTVAALTEVRAGIEGKGEQAFRDAAKRVSEGRGASEGGQQDVEPGVFPTEVDQRIFTLEPGTLSEVFTANQAAWLVYVVSRDKERIQTFEEVQGELRRSLEAERRKALRARVAAMLRGKASINDVASVDSLLE